MSDIVIVAVIPSTLAALVAFGALLVSWGNARKADVIAHRAAAIAKQTEGIHALVNSQLTAVKAELISAQQKIAELQALIVALNQGGPR